MAMPPRSHPLVRSHFARRLDALLAKSWTLPGNPKPPLDPDYLWARGAKGFDAADEHGGRSAGDVADFRERLERLCTSLQQEAQLNALGHTMAYGQLTAAISTRHRLGRLWRTRPDVPEGGIAPPIIVAGQMRAGTTRVHRLLAADPAHAGTRFCDSFNPAPRSPDYRPLKSAIALALARRMNPWLDALHPFGATRVDEEIGWLSLSLSPAAYEAQWHIPSYVEWSEARDPTPVYGEFARILRTDAATAGNRDKPRVLKCPQYAEDLATMLHVFPDARVVVPRRDREQVLESAVSLVASQMAAQSEHASLASIQREWQRKLALRDERIEQSLAPFDGPVARVRFEELNADWQGAMAAVYRDIRIALTPAALAAMRSEMARAAKQHHGRHRDQIEAFDVG